MSIESIEQFFKARKGYLYNKDIAHNRTLQKYLRRLVLDGKAISLKRGLYKHLELAELDHWQEISLMYPKAVICSVSAVAYYNLSTYMPHQIHLAVAHKSRLRTAAFPPVKLYYWADKYYHQHTIHKNGVNIYSTDRTVCDIVRLYEKTDPGMVKEVAQNYLGRADRNLPLLMKTATEIDVQEKVNNVFKYLV